MDESIYRLISFSGFFLVAFIAWVTGSRQRVNVKTIIGSMALAWVLGALTFWLSWSRSALQWINDVLVAILTASHKGALFLFGPLALGPGQTMPDGSPSIGFILAFQVFPSVIFFSAVISGLYYLGIMQAVVRFFARIFYRLLTLSGAESLSAAANIFVGIESGLTIHPYLMKMTRSELLTLMTCMMATVASTVMGIYIIALRDIFPQIAGHLISASLISIPCAVIASKLSLPEQKVPETLGELPEADTDTEKPSNVMVALFTGGSQGVKMAVGIATVLIVVLGLEALVDLALAKSFGQNISVQTLLGWLTVPFSALLGLRPEEWQLAGQILGSRFIETEVSAYFALAQAQITDPVPFTQRSIIILTYALCGFVHLASLGIFIGGLTALAPARAHDITVIGGRALWTAFLATVLTGCIAGALVMV
ncbi:MAG: nucleoside permease nupX [Nitrospina sp.]|nr:nucleoside permease nupX [Nitrospina sp.]MBT3415049.1 nucleoside permease nupX [Nitrospina sp.]MBT3855622.1 nucleoside permease nupX [Nitrospina sp.]MBT4104719.1 nucleoside permease nupX [Nitrospina sp.]MBT4390393.1 nucleoside permease nupX [Nitrospina sp.]